MPQERDTSAEKGTRRSTSAAGLNRSVRHRGRISRERRFREVDQIEGQDAKEAEKAADSRTSSQGNFI